MRIIIFTILLLSSFQTFAQEKKLLEKQLTDLLKDYPNNYRNQRNPKDTFFLKFEISGTYDPPIIMDGKSGVYTSSSLGFLDKEADAKSWFDDWVEMLSSLTLNGYKLKKEECTGGKLTKYCKRWVLDNSNNNIPAKFRSFSLELQYSSAGKSFLGTLYVGSTD